MLARNQVGKCRYSNPLFKGELPIISMAHYSETPIIRKMSEWTVSTFVHQRVIVETKAHCSKDLNRQTLMSNIKHSNILLGYIIHANAGGWPSPAGMWAVQDVEGSTTHTSLLLVVAATSPVKVDQSWTLPPEAYIFFPRALLLLRLCDHVI